MNEFEMGERFMLHKLKAKLEGAKDNIQVAVRTLNFIRKEDEEHERKNNRTTASKNI